MKLGRYLFLTMSLWILLVSAKRLEYPFARDYYLAGDTLYWSPDRKLDSADFQGPRDFSDTVFTHDRQGQSCLSFSYQWKLVAQQLKITAFAIFKKKCSWLDEKTPAALKHEQGHFDIQEIYAKKLEKMVNDGNIKNLDSSFMYMQQCQQIIFRELIAEQKRYDTFSFTAMGRADYNKWIDEQLKLYSLK
jgi:hypothetical protein